MSDTAVAIQMLNNKIIGLQNELAKERERRESAESILRILIPTMYVMRVKDDGTTEDARMTIPYHEALAKKHFKKYEGDKSE